MALTRPRLSALVFASFIALSSPAHADPLKVVASFSILGDMVQQVGGPDVAVTTLVGPDADTHEYEPSAQDAKRVAGADIVFVNGLGFEGWMPKLLDAAKAKQVVTVSQGVTAGEMDEDGKTVTDPHAWQNPANAVIYVANIAKALEAAIPGDAAAIQKRADAYTAEIKAFDAEAHREIDAIPQEKRKLVTSHDAFGYFGRAYDVQVLAAAGLSTEDEPSAADIAKLGDQIKQEKVKTVFLENMSNPRLISQIAKDTGAKVGGTLFADALSTKPEGQHYLSALQHNLRLIVAAMKENG